MPIVVNCPGCPTKLSAPESAAGKQIRCPKCGATAPVPNFVPAEEVPVVDAKPLPPKPKPKPIVAEEEDERPRKKAKASRDDDDDEDEDDRPRKKKKRSREDDDYDHDLPRHKRGRAGSKGGGGGGGKVAIIVIAGLLLLGGVGFGIYMLVGKNSPFAKRAPVPAGWKLFESPNHGFKGYFPSDPQLLMSVNGGFPAVGGAFPGMNELPEVESSSIYTCGDVLFGGRTGGVSITVSVTRFRNSLPRNIRDDPGRIGGGKFGNAESRRVRWLGSDATEVVFGNIVARRVLTDKVQVEVQIIGPNGQRAKPEEEAGFFDNFELTK